MDLDSAIEQRPKAAVSIPLNSPDRHVVYTSLGTSYPRRFERVGAMKDIDSPVEQQLKAAASVPLKSVYRPDIFGNLGSMSGWMVW